MSKLANVVFWFLPGTHNLSQTWKIKNSRNVTLLGGNDLTSSDKNSEGMSKILCQEGLRSAGISVSKSNFTVVENITIAYCIRSSALVFDAAVNTTVRNVTITRSFGCLEVSSCLRFTLTNSAFEYCYSGISLLASWSSEISNSKVSDCLIVNILWVYGGSVALNQVISDGGQYGISFMQGSAKLSSLGEKLSVNISNSRIMLRKRSTSAIYVQLGKDQPIDINIDTVSITGNGGGILGISIIDYSPEAGSKPNYATARIHNVTIENFGHPSNITTTATPAAMYLLSLRNLTISNCTIKNNGVTGIVLFASTALLQGNITLTNNTGLNGGGMALYSSSFIVLDALTRLQISNNSAAMFGGGIYVSQDIISYRTSPSRIAFAFCFASSISKHDQPLLEFTGNKANNSGQDMYGAYVTACLPPLYSGKSTTPVPVYVHSVCHQTLIS